MTHRPWHARLHVTPLIFACLSLFVGTSIMVVFGAILPLDVSIMQWIGERRSYMLIEAMLVMSFVGDGTPLTIVGLGIAVLLWRLRGRRAGIAMLAGGLLGQVVYMGMKAAFARPRPEIIERLSSHGWHSYPSGHTTLTVIILSLGMILLADALPKLRHVFWLLAVLAPLNVAFARVGLGSHYPSDVVGGLALGGAWVFWWRDWSRRPATSASADTA